MSARSRPIRRNGARRSPPRPASFHACKGLDLAFLNVGGGLPAQYRTLIPSLEAYAAEIEAALREHFGGARPDILIEPGRYLVGDAGVLRIRGAAGGAKIPPRREALGLSRRRPLQWPARDAGRTHPLSYPHAARRRTLRARGARRPDLRFDDIIYEHAGYELPLDLEIGEPLDFLSAGAYTASYAAVEFNGFAPIRTYCI